MNAKQIAALAKNLGLKSGKGTYNGSKLRYSHNGLPVTVEQLQDIVNDAEYRKYIEE
jgi:hypothetical protein